MADALKTPLPRALEGLAMLAACVAAAPWLIPFGMPVLLVVATLVLRAHGRRWSDLGLRRRNVSWRTVATAAAFAAVITAVGLLAVLPLAERIAGSPIDLGMFHKLRGNTGVWLALLALGWTYAALGEEMLFRGFALDRLTAGLPGRLGVTLAVVLQAVAFGLAHRYQGPAGMVVTGVIGLALAGIYLGTGRNLALVVLTHGMVDTLVFTGFYAEIL